MPPEDRVMITWFNETDGPFGEIEADKLTVPENPKLARLTLDVVTDPGVTSSPLGFAET